jgi:adenine-specific DNA-methyltransferase
MIKKNKLELTWIGKENRHRLEPRILSEEANKSYHAQIRISDHDIFDNILIRGDNLLALKSLQQQFAGKVQCIYIDPPFNTGGAFEHYDDGVEHSIWLDLMYQRLLLLHSLLSPSGALVVNLDDTEAAYCKVILDEIFGRPNYVTTIVVEAATSSSFKTFNVGPTQVAQYLLFYAKDKSQFQYNQQYLPIYEVDLQHFSRFVVNMNDPAEQWKFQSINDHILTGLGFHGDTPNAKWSAAKKKLGDDAAKELVREKAVAFALENCYRVFETKTLQKPSRWLHEHLERSLELDHVIGLKRDGLESLYLYKGRQVYFLGKGVKELDGEKVVTQPVSNIWTDIPTNNLKDEGGVDFPAGKKPEELLRRVIQMISAKKGDIVLDSFGGSGTTAAVAHKAGRRWITIENGDHCETHILPRLHRVVDGLDQSGVTQITRWKGGGGFQFFRLAPSLLEKDKFGNWVISKQYRAEMLAEAMCKLEGFTYAPSDSEYWMHGHSTERDFIFVTTQTLTREQLQKLSDEVGENRSLLVCCSAFRVKDVSQFANLTIKKIPKMVLNRCEWGRDDYSLEIKNLPEPSPLLESGPVTPTNGRRKTANGSMNLFEAAAEENHSR